MKPHTWLARAAAMIAVAVSAAACGNSVSGSPVPVSQGARVVPGPLSERLLPAGYFTAPYVAEVAPASLVSGVGSPGAGIPERADVSPADCTPSREHPSEAAALVASNDKDRSTITEVIAREGTSLSDFGDQVSSCGELTARMQTVSANVRREVVDCPQVPGADAVLGVRMNVSSGSVDGRPALVTRTTAYYAQFGDVWVSVTYMGESNPPELVEQAFSAAVNKAATAR